MSRLAPTVNAVSGVLLIVFPPAAAAAMLLAGAARRLRRPPSAWLVVWAGYLLPVAAVAVVTGRDLLMPTLQAIFGVALGLLVVVARPRALTIGIAVGLVAAAGAGLLERELSRRLWWDATTPTGVAQLLSGVSELSGDSDGWSRNGVRLFQKSWDTGSAGQAPYTLSFDVRGTSPTFGWQWYTNDPATVQQLLVEGKEPFTRLSGLVASVVKRVRTAEPLAGRTVRATVDLRSAAAITLADEIALALRTFEPSASLRQPVEIGPEWQTFQATFTFPAEARQGAFEVVIGATAVEHLDVRDLRLEESKAGEWIAFGPAEPAGVNVRVPLTGVHVFAQPTLNLRPTSSWTSHSLQVPGELSGELAGGLARELPVDLKHLSALLQVESGTDIELRNVRLVSDETQAAALAEPKARSRLLFEQANLAGHSYVASGLLALVLATAGAGGSMATVATRRRRLAAGLVVTFAMQAAVATTGSRTAFFGGALAAIVLLISSQLPRSARPRRRLFMALAAAVMLVLAFVGFGVGGDALGRLAFWQDAGGGANQVSRVEIWETGLAGVRQAPLTGWGADGFREVWRSGHPGDDRAVPQHGHDFWLQMTVAYGLPGLLAALWLSGGLLLLAARTKRPEPLIVIAAVLAMQLLDHTLTYIGVLAPLVLLLNTGTSSPGDG